MTIFDLTREINPEQLEREIMAAHGWRKPPGLSVRQPGQSDPDGKTLPGVLILGRDDADPTLVRKALGEHKPQPTAHADRLDDLERRLAALEAKQPTKP